MESGRPVRCKECGGTGYVMAKNIGAVPCPECADGNPVEGERRWSMQEMWCCPHGKYGFDRRDYPCASCKYFDGCNWANEPCASCTVRPSGFEER